MGTIHTCSNYDFLEPKFYESVRNGSGSNLKLDLSNPFSKVLQGSSVLWTAFIENRIPYPFQNPEVFGVNGRNALVGASVEVGAGHVVFLPNFQKLDETLFFEACVEYRVRREGTPAPEWTSSFHLPGQAEIEKSIVSLDADIKAKNERRQLQLANLEDLSAYKKLLFEKGKTQLEPIVSRALNQLGFQASPAETISGTGFEIDGRTKADSTPGIIEIKGSKNQISLEEFGKFPTKILSDFQVRNVLSKGVLVGNGLCLERPEKRLGSGILDADNYDCNQPQNWHRIFPLDRALRYQTAADLRADLQRVKRDYDAQPRSSTSGSSDSGSRASNVAATPSVPGQALSMNKPVLVGIAAGILLLLGAAYYIGKTEGSANSTSPPSYRQLTFRGGTIRMARFDPEGKSIVYSAAWEGNPYELFLRRPDSPESRAFGLKGAEVLSVSSTGEMAVLLGSHNVDPYINEGTLGRVPLGGGAPREVLEKSAMGRLVPRRILACCDS